MPRQLTPEMDGQSYFEHQQLYRQQQGWKLVSLTFLFLFVLVAVEVFAVRQYEPEGAKLLVQVIACAVMGGLLLLASLRHLIPSVMRWQVISSVMALIFGLGWAALFMLPLYGGRYESVALYSDLFTIIAVIGFFSYRSATYCAVLPVLAAWMVSDMVVAGSMQPLVFFTAMVRLTIVVVVREYLFYWFHSSVWRSYEEQRLRLELANVALIDNVTGLQNDRHFSMMLSREVLSARRQNTALSVVALYIDPLREHGMTYGQQEAKEVLRRIGRGLRRGVFRPRDFLARQGNDEFALLLPYTNEEGAKIVAERLSEQVHLSCDHTIRERLKKPVAVKAVVLEWQPDMSEVMVRQLLRTSLEALREENAEGDCVRILGHNLQ
ncbi:hypothetical protein ABT56_08135 [Photobacterium aquae]|uniref:diguanylate cyclase n=1 Tax=Photobacterium aquae TaxID=1195763 RepID=A0A0J1H4A0_9GAMM|nr:GGDEF domain-containing protein [Photobacterium aquae]KLV06590.1 hypothetical protein ABT56_08135 [Photobacterium aquae]